jgi:hypothetical protein
MTRKGFTTFGVGATAHDAFDRTLAPLPNGIVRVQEVAVPEGMNPSKLGTWIQRLALDGTLADEAPAEHHVHIRTAAGALDDPNVVLALDMTGNPAGDKMRERMKAGDAESAYLLIGLTAAE